MIAAKCTTTAGELVAELPGAVLQRDEAAGSRVALHECVYLRASSYSEASISARPETGSMRLRRCSGVSVTTNSSVGRT